MQGWLCEVSTQCARFRENGIYKEYGITHHVPGTYEIDHLISLELGGSNDKANLWPESYSGPNNAHDKDKVENALHQQVCSKIITLAEAQMRLRRTG
jgi:hypothetical protein